MILQLMVLINIAGLSTIDIPARLASFCDYGSEPVVTHMGLAEKSTQLYIYFKCIAEKETEK